MKDLRAVTGLAVMAYVVGRRSHSQPDKRDTASHYAALAPQVADEPTLAGLESRLTNNEVSRCASRAVSSANRVSAWTGERQHG